MKKLIFVLIFLSTMQLTQALSQIIGPYNDVSNFDFYHEAIEYLTDINIINGNPDGSFRPFQEINRAEMIKIVVLAYLQYNDLDESHLSPYSNKNCFEDVAKNQWYTKYICFAKDKSWVVGYDNSRYFKPSKNVSFVEALKTTLHAIGVTKENNDKIWYKKYVDYASEKNYIPFTINNFHHPFHRDEMSDLITRVLMDQKNELNYYLKLRKHIVVSYKTINSKLYMAHPDVFGKIIKNSPDCVKEGDLYFGMLALGNYCCGELINVPNLDYEYLCVRP